MQRISTISPVFLIYVYCDTDVFIAEIDQEDGTYQVNKGDLCATGTMMTNINGSKGLQTLWFSTKNVTGSGSLFTVTLKVAEDAKDGEYSIGLGYSEENTIDVNAKPQLLSMQGGSICVVGQSTDEQEEEDPSEPEIPVELFSDVPENNWAFPYVMALYERGIVSGGGDGRFYPEKQVTRAEFVKMLAGVAGAKVSLQKSTQFKDVPRDSWFAPYVAWAYEKGITKGITETEFGPHALITREQMATLVVRLCEKQKIDLQKIQNRIAFTDESSIADYAKKAVGEVQRAGLISGYPDGTFLPKANAKRHEAAKVLASLLALIETAE